MNLCYFVTGTDTSVGKTTVTCALLSELIQKTNWRVAGFKPVATGAHYDEKNKRYCNEDAMRLKEASNIDLTYDEINPYCFRDPTSPHIASELAGSTVSPRLISDHLSQLKSKTNLVFVEGAGGWHTPLGEKTRFSDWVIAEKMPVILVVPLKLGCLNHAQLTQQAILHARLPLAGWILNHIEPKQPYDEAYKDTLLRHMTAPLIGTVSYGGHRSDFCLSLFDKGVRCVI